MQFNESVTFPADSFLYFEYRSLVKEVMIGDVSHSDVTTKFTVGENKELQIHLNTELTTLANFLSAGR